MSQHASPRFWAAAVSAAASAVLSSLTLLWPEWIESVTGIDPDHGSGSFEWMIAAGFAVVAAALTLLAWRTWRRVSPASA